MKIDLNIQPYENCPSFDVCQVNACPLHKDYLVTLFDLKEDKSLFGWKKCRCSKSKRMSIAKAFKLSNLGLTKKEYSSYQLSMKMKQTSATPHTQENGSNFQGDNKQETLNDTNKKGFEVKK